MLTLKLRLIGTTGVGRMCCVISLTWLAFGWATPAFPADGADAADSPVVAAGTADKPAAKMRLAPIITRVGGNVGYEIEQRSVSGSSPRLRQRIALTLQGRGLTYIYKPWIALVRANLNFTGSKNKYQDSSFANNSIWGDAGLYLVPYSRYPFDARISKTENYSGQGLGSLAYQTTRLDLTQRFTPKEGKERYQLGYIRSKTEDNTPEVFRQSEINFSFGSNRFISNTLLLDGFRQRNTRQYNGDSSQFNQLLGQHRYAPSSQFNVSNNAILRSTYEYTQLGPTLSRNRELNSVTYYQPSKARYNLIGSARVHFVDYESSGNTSYARAANANLGGNYRLSQYITLSASGNANVRENSSSRTTSLSTHQSANANYPLASFDLGNYHYNSRVSGAISNSTSSSRQSGSLIGGQAGSTQTVSINPSHSLSSKIFLGRGTLNLRFDQMLNASESTRSQAIARLTHSATAGLRRGNTALTLTGRDSRSLNSAQDTFQYVGLNGSVSEEINRQSSFSGVVSVQSTRQISTTRPDSITRTNSSLNLHYVHNRAFNIPRLTFDSNLRAYSLATLPVLAASPDNQGPVDWENTFTYKVGLLSADFKVVLSKEGDGKSRSLIWFAVKRYF